MLTGPLRPSTLDTRAFHPGARPTILNTPTASGPYASVRNLGHTNFCRVARQPCIFMSEEQAAYTGPLAGRTGSPFPRVQFCDFEQRTSDRRRPPRAVARGYTVAHLQTSVLEKAHATRKSNRGGHLEEDLDRLWPLPVASSRPNRHVGSER